MRYLDDDPAGLRLRREEWEIDPATGRPTVAKRPDPRFSSLGGVDTNGARFGAPLGPVSPSFAPVIDQATQSALTDLSGRSDVISRLPSADIVDRLHLYEPRDYVPPVEEERRLVPIDRWAVSPTPTPAPNSPPIPFRFTAADQRRGRRVPAMPSLANRRISVNGRSGYVRGKDAATLQQLQTAFDNGGSVAEIVTLARDLGLSLRGRPGTRFLSQLRASVAVRDTRGVGNRIVPHQLVTEQAGPRPGETIREYISRISGGAQFKAIYTPEHPFGQTAHQRVAWLFDALGYSDSDERAEAVRGIPVVGTAMDADDALRSLSNGQIGSALWSTAQALAAVVPPGPRQIGTAAARRGFKEIESWAAKSAAQPLADRAAINSSLQREIGAAVEELRETPIKFDGAFSRNVGRIIKSSLPRLSAETRPAFQETIIRGLGPLVVRNDATAEELRIFIGYLREEGAKWANVPGAREYVVALRQMEARAAGLLQQRGRDTVQAVRFANRVQPPDTSAIRSFVRGPDISPEEAYFAQHGEYRPGTFWVDDWTRYRDDWAWRPQNPFARARREDYILEAAERKRFHDLLRRRIGIVNSPFQVHDVRELIFGGRAADLRNKVLVTSPVHYDFNRQWSPFERWTRQFGE